MLAGKKWKTEFGVEGFSRINNVELTLASDQFTDATDTFLVFLSLNKERHTAG